MDVQKPTTITTPDGIELTKNKTAQGMTVSDGSNDRVLIGFQKNGFGDGKDYGIKVSQPGFDVKTASDDDLVMSSGFNSFKIVDTGTTSVDGFTITFTGNDWRTGSANTTRIAHGLGFTPIVMAYLDTGSSVYSQIPRTLTSTVTGVGGGFVNEVFTVSSDSTYIYFTHSGFGFNAITTSYSQTSIKYYLLVETAN